MIELKSQLYVKCEIASVFSDYSHKAATFGRDSFTIDLSSSDAIYVGFRKPVNSFYINHKSTYTVEGTLTLEYYNGATWVDSMGLSDDTLGLMRSGFIKFDQSQVAQATHSVDGVGQYWYRIKSSEDRDALEVSGFNLVFADDNDLMNEQPYITTDSFLDTRYRSHILTHVAVRNDIIQKFRNKDFYKVDSEGLKQDINQWDLFSINEINQAAIYLALSKIYFNISDSMDDEWHWKSIEYRNKYEACIQSAMLSLDFNDNGVKDLGENKSQSVARYLSR